MGVLWPGRRREGAWCAWCGCEWWGSHWAPGGRPGERSGRDVEWNVVVNMINAALFYSNVPWMLNTHDTPISRDWTINSAVTGLWLTGDAQINDGQTPINHITQNRELVRDRTQWSLQDDSTHRIQESKHLPESSMYKLIFVSSQKSEVNMSSM